MPYIARDRREKLDPVIGLLQDELNFGGFSEGELNYVLSRFVGHYFRKQRRYYTIARVTGVLQNVAQEFYRRMAAPYEDEAIQKNGDIPEYE